MSNHSGLDKKPVSLSAVPISFAEKFMRSAQFQAVFQEGMALVEEASSYLDSSGRQESKELDGNLSFAYATESMRLTTRLMQVASWLLIKRALNDGEMTIEQADKEEEKLNIYSSKPVQKVESFDELPETLRKLVTKSFSFHQRMQRIDEMMRKKDEDYLEEEVVESPITQQLAELELAFGRAKRA